MIPSTPQGRKDRSGLCAGLLALSWIACADDPPAPTPECVVTADCGQGRVCTAEQKCIADAECGTDQDCDPRRACSEAHECLPRPGFGDDCDAERPCAFGEFCSPLLGLCQSSDAARDCTRRSQCPAGQICDREAAKCVSAPGCYGPEFCEDGEVCDLVTHVCRSAATACVPCDRGACESGECRAESKECVLDGVDPSCREGERCDPLGRCVQCTRTADCGPGLYCNAALGRCESNVVCAQTASECPTSPDVSCVTCTAPQVCDERTRRCQAPPTECETDVDCVGDQYCDFTLDPPICVLRLPACIDDRQGEPNDDVAHAALLEADVVSDLRACPGTEDWYTITASAGTHLTIDARFLHADGDLDLQLFLPDGVTLVDQSRSVTDNERVEIEAGTALRVKLRVFFATRALAAVPYSLLIGRESGAICADDVHEPDDSLAEAKLVESDRPYAGTLCAGDPDWYVVPSVASGTRMIVTLDHRRALGDLDLELYRPSSPIPLIADRGREDGARIEYDAAFSGDYYVRVVGKEADANVYTLRVNLRANVGPTCVDDRFEPSDQPSDATASPEDTTEVAAELSICASDEDWYRVNLGPEEAVRAEIGFSASADLELALYAPGTLASRDAPLTISSGVGPRESIAYRAVQPGDYMLRVHAPRDSDSSAYELRLQRDPPLFCEPDAIDEAGKGNTREDAIDLGASPTRADEVSFCEGDADWFKALLPAGYVNVIRLAFVGSDAELDMVLYDAQGNQLIATAGVGGDFREIAARVPGPTGAFAETYVEIVRGAGVESLYSLAFDLVPIFSCSPDSFEVNDAPEVATAIEALPFADESLTLCVSEPSVFGLGDEDWFQFVPPSGARFSVELEHDEGDLLLELFSPGGARRACLNLGLDRCFSDGPGHSEQLVFTATVAAPYVLRVASIYGNPAFPSPFAIDTPYRLRVELVP